MSRLPAFKTTFNWSSNENLNNPAAKSLETAQAQKQKCTLSALETESVCASL